MHSAICASTTDRCLSVRLSQTGVLSKRLSKWLKGSSRFSAKRLCSAYLHCVIRNLGINLRKFVCSIFNKIMLLSPGYSTSFVLLSWYAQWLTSRIRKSDVTGESWDLSVSILQASAIGRARHVTRVRLNGGTASDETHFIRIIRRLTRPPA